MKLRFLFLFIGINSIWYVKGQKSLSELLPANNNPGIICGHRGGYYVEFPENSLVLFNHINDLINPTAWMIETDIRQSSDGVLYLMHDKDLDRTTSGTGDIAKSTSKYLNQLVLKDQSGNLTDYNISKFADLLSWCQDKNVFLMLDIKDDSWSKAIEMVQKYNLEDRCILLTFNNYAFEAAIKFRKYSLVSILVSSLDEYLMFQSIIRKHKNLAAYITSSTASEVIDELYNNKLITLSDTRELWNGQTNVMSEKQYIDYINRLKANILITDFPIEVSKIDFSKN